VDVDDIRAEEAVTIARVRLVPSDLIDAKNRQTIRERLGPDRDVPNLYRALANAPEMLEGWLSFAWRLRADAKSDRRIRELMILRVAQLLDSPYEWHHHVTMALHAGVSQQQIDALAHWPTSALFDDADREALRMCEEQTLQGAASADIIAAIRARHGDEITVELVLTASFYNCVARLLNSLAVPLEVDGN
jgi:4-carboxymuconolactone decarboxylase